MTFKAEAMEALRNLRDQLKELEDQGLEDTAEYEDVSSDYQELALDVLPGLSETAYCTLYTYEHDYDQEVAHGDYDSYIIACDIGDEMLESGEIMGYYVETHEDEGEQE